MDIYGTGGYIDVGSQVVVKGHGMGTVETVGCPVFPEGGLAYHVRIEGDREAICFPAHHVQLYADVYAASGEPPDWDWRNDHPEPVSESEKRALWGDR